MLRWLSGLFAGRTPRLLALASTVRVSERQFPTVHRLVQDAASTLDLAEVPETFIVSDPRPNARTVGIDKPFMLLNSGLVDLMDEEELRFVLGHEMGHILSGHAVYRSMLDALLTLSRRVFFIPVGYLGLRALLTALEEWHRKSELSCDRAGLLAGQGPAGALPRPPRGGSPARFRPWRAARKGRWPAAPASTRWTSRPSSSRPGSTTP